MTDEEYLRACGWFEPRTTIHGWTHPRRGMGEVQYDLAEAVDLQVAEDRALLAFVLARSDVTLSTSEPSADPLNPFRQSVNIDVSAWHIEAK